MSDRDLASVGPRGSPLRQSSRTDAIWTVDSRYHRVDTLLDTDRSRVRHR